MTTILCVLALAVQDDLDARLTELSGRLAKDPASAALAELCGGDAGRAAIRERVDALVARRARRIDHDPIGHFEERLFREDPAGALHPRPERRDEFERLAKEVESAHLLMGSFNRRALELSTRIAGDGEIEKRARAWWADSTFRVALFMSRPDDFRDRDLAWLLHDFLGGGTGADGKALDGPRRDHVLASAQGLRDRLERIRELEQAYLKILAGQGDELRRTLVTEAAAVFVIGRVLRQAEDEAPEPVGRVSEGDPAIELAVTPADLAAMLKEAETAVAELAGWFDATASRLGNGPDEEALAALLRDPRARMLIAERLTGRRAEQAARGKAVFDEILADGFEGEGTSIRVKKGRYVDEAGQESPDALDAEHRGIVDGFLAGRRELDLIAELCADPKAAWTFASPAGTLVLRERIEEARAEARRPIEAQGYALFAALYLDVRGDSAAVKPAQALRIQELTRRAARILKEWQQAQ